MIISSLLNVIIGLFLVYFLLSSMASVVSEIIGTFLQRRANSMAQFIVDMFHEQANADHPNATAFYASQIFQLKTIGGFLGLVAEVGRRVLGWLHKIRWIGKWIPDGVPIVAGSQQVLSISNGNFSQAVFEVLKFGIGGDAHATFDQLQKMVTDSPLLSDSPIKSALIVAIQQADGSVEKVAAHLERWFDGQMAQLSDLYKRRTRGYLFVIGIVLAFALNVDSIAIFQKLEGSPEAQASARAAAEAVVGNGTSAVIPTPEATAESDVGQLTQKINDLTTQFQAFNTQLTTLGLPIGWDSANPPIIWTSPQGLLKLLGLIITSAAIALGAQFWFDLLKLLTGRPPSGGSSS